MLRIFKNSYLQRTHPVAVSESITPSIHKIVKHRLKILQHLLLVTETIISHFFTCINPPKFYNYIKSITWFIRNIKSKNLKIKSRNQLNHILPMLHFCTPHKTSENRRYRNVTLGEYGLININGSFHATGLFL